MAFSSSHLSDALHTLYRSNRKIGHALIMTAMILGAAFATAHHPYADVLKKLMIANVIAAGLLTGTRGALYICLISVCWYAFDFAKFGYYAFRGLIELAGESGFLVLFGLVSGWISKIYFRTEIQATLERDRIEELTLRIERKAEKLRVLRSTLVDSFVQALEAKDPLLKGHSARVRDLSVIIARAMKLSDLEIRLIREASLLHDIGKIGVTDEILGKQGKLTAIEIAELQTHPVVGEEILSPMELFAEHRELIRHYHERYDGHGYPDGLSADDIPLGSRIIAVADAFDAMTTDRSYRKRLSDHHAVLELIRNRGTQFDPQIVDIVISMVESGKLVSYVEINPEELSISRKPSSTETLPLFN